jgi:hypothetical protein
MDLALYGHTYGFFAGGDGDGDTSFILGARAELTRGFFDVKPYLALQVLADMDQLLPISAVFGAQKSIYLRRLEFGLRGGLAFGSNALVVILEENFSDSDDPWFTHIGASAGGFLSFLVTRDIKAFVEVQADYLFGWTGLFPSYGGYQLGAGVSFKL